MIARHDRVGKRVASFVLAILVALISVGTAGAAAQMLRGHVPEAARNLTALGRLEGGRQLSLAISLPLRNQEELTNLLRDLYDPNSPGYRQYLTPAQFAERFGPTEADYQAVADFAASNGLTVTRTYSNRALIDVEGPVTNIERALHLRLQTFRHPTEARTFFAPDAEPSPDLAVPVLSIIGLDNFELPHPMNLVRTNRIRALATANNGSAPDGVSYMGSDFRKAYLPGAPASLNGAGQILGLFELDGYYPNDITTYESVAHLPNVPLTNVLVDNFDGSAGSANLEVALDIDMAISMAPGLSQIVVYEGTTPNDVLNVIATHGVAKQISSSWAWSGYPNVPSMDQIFQQMAAQGQTFFNASGDSGAYTSSIASPSDDPNITSVGGTTLFTDTNGNWQSEQVWSWFPNQAAASSGGSSRTYAIPTWQQGMNMSTNLGSTSKRNIPDVALTADNLFIYADNGIGYSGVGGTSAAAPLWAGLTALVNQQAVAGGNPTVGFLNPTLYSLAQGASYPLLFHDITVGNNFTASSSPKFPAVPGYDLCTGWGTPAGTNLINALAPVSNAPVVKLVGGTLTGEGCLPTNGAVDPGETVTFTYTFVNDGTAATTNLVATLLTNNNVLSPSAPQTYGAIPPGGGTVSRSFSFTAAGSCGALITNTLQLQDGASNLGTFTCIIALGAITPVSSFAENFDGVTAPALPSGWTTSTTGSGIAWKTSTANHDSGNNSVWAGEPNHQGDSSLVSPAIPIAIPNAQLTFRHMYATGNIFDGGVLEIQIGSGPYTDILAAGGSFATGGYSAVLGTGFGNPVGGRWAWTGNSGGFITTVVNLPVAAAGQTIHLKWRFGTDSTVSGSGWYVDTISIQDGIFSCCTGSADVAVSETASTNPAVVGRNFSYTITVTNNGPGTAAGVTVTDTLPANVTFVSASLGCTFANGKVTCNIGTFASAATTNLQVTVTPTVTGPITNLVSISSLTFDAVSANNSAGIITTVDSPPVITAQPTNATVVMGNTASFSIGASGVPAPTFNWLFNSGTVGSSSNLVLSNVQPSQAGQYFVIVSNVVGSTSSIPVTLTVLVRPVITNQPASQVVAQGSSVSFLVGATGTPTLSYQWLYNGSNVVASGTNLIVLTNVQPGQMGTYSVLVTNSAGATNSVGAQLTVLVQPSVASISVTSTNVAISFPSVLGLNYSLQYKNDATATNWTSILPSTPGTGGLMTLYDTNALPTLRLYRINCD